MYDFVTHGKFGHPSYKGIFYMDKSNVIFGRIYLVVQSFYIKLLGLNIFSIRFPQLLFLFGSLILLFKLGENLYGRKVAILAALLYGTSFQFFWQSHNARPESMFVFFILLSIYLLFQAEKHRSAPTYFFSGLILGFTPDIHMNGFLITTIVIVSYAITFGPRKIISKYGLFFALGLLAGFAYWFIVHIALNSSMFFVQWNSVWKENRFSDTRYLSPAILQPTFKDFFLRIILQA